jgi:hypothetical protein
VILSFSNPLSTASFSHGLQRLYPSWQVIAHQLSGSGDGLTLIYSSRTPCNRDNSSPKDAAKL